MRRLLVPSALTLAFALMVPLNGYAQQSVNFSIGGFVPKGVDSRTDGDVLVNNLDFLAFELDDFGTASYNGEWEFPLAEHLNASVGIGLTNKSVPSVYADFVEDDFSEIEQDLKLRIVPFTATIRFLPLRRDAPVQPYIGGGVGLFWWRYTETGEFVDFDSTIFRETYIGDGAAAGPVILGGVRFGLGSWDLGGFNYLVTANIRF